MSSLAIITGASRGIGKATALEFIKNGWKVINLSRTDCDIDDVINVNINLRKLDNTNNLIKHLENYLKSSNQISLIHNACCYVSGNTLSISIQDFQEYE